MDENTYREARKTSKEIEIMLQAGNLNPEEAVKLRELRAQLSGVLMRPWFPVGWSRKAIMLLVFLAGSYGLTDGHRLFLILYALLPLFCPCLVGELANAYGRFVMK